MRITFVNRRAPLGAVLACIALACIAAPSMVSAQEPAAPAGACPAGYPSADFHASWKSRVDAAQAMTDSIAKRNAMVDLVREALPGVQVRLAGNSSPYKPHPDDYVPYPVVNFDMHLADKRDAPTSYYFTNGANAYVVLGPSAVHARGPVTTLHNATHEIYHVVNHIGDVRPTLDKEVELWTHIFTTTFHWAYPYKLLWNPLMSSYENASPAEQAITLYQLTNYYRTPVGVPAACVPAFRAEFDGWVSRRINDEKGAWKLLVRGLQKELDIKVPPPTPAKPDGTQ